MAGYVELTMRIVGNTLIVHECNDPEELYTFGHRADRPSGFLNDCVLSSELDETVKDCFYTSMSADKFKMWVDLHDNGTGEDDASLVPYTIDGKRFENVPSDFAEAVRQKLLKVERAKAALREIFNAEMHGEDSSLDL